MIANSFKFYLRSIKMTGLSNDDNFLSYFATNAVEALAGIVSDAMNMMDFEQK
jgi:hypothetical protein